MAFESKFARFIRHGGSGAFTLRLDGLEEFERKYAVAPGNLLGSISDNALVDGLADLNQYLPEGLSANIKGVDFSDIKAQLAAAIGARIGVIGLPVDENDPVIKAAIQQAAAQVSARLQQDKMGVTEFIWRSQDDARVRPQHQGFDDQIFAWKTPPEDGPPGEAYGCRCSAEPVFTVGDLPEGATCERLTAGKLRSVFPNADEARLAAFAEALDAVVDIGKLDSTARLFHFLAQASIEMGSEANTVEGFNYNPHGLRTTFDRYFDAHPDEAEELGRTDGHPADRETIANRVYGNRFGNGDEATGAGWRYRGRGMFHTTFHDNYLTVTNEHRKLFGENIDFVARPELLEVPKYAARAAAIFWLDHGLEDLADLGVTQDAFNAVRNVINAGESDEDTQRHWDNLQVLRDTGVLDRVCEFSVSHPSFGAL